MIDLEKISYLVRITGRVQGVCFRSWTMNQASLWKVSGWVRSRRDGSVEAVICGSPLHVQEMLRAFKIGPQAAQVTSVDATPCNPPDEPGFRQFLSG